MKITELAGNDSSRINLLIAEEEARYLGKPYILLRIETEEKVEVELIIQINPFSSTVEKVFLLSEKGEHFTCKFYGFLIIESVRREIYICDPHNIVPLVQNSSILMASVLGEDIVNVLDRAEDSNRRS